MFTTSDHLTNPNTFIKTLTLSFLALSLFFAFKHFSTTTATTFTLPTPTVTTVTTTAPSSPPPPSPPPPSPPPPPQEVVSRTGIVDENGAMSDEFVIGDYDAKLIKNDKNESVVVEKDENLGKVERFRVCDESKREYIPCLDNVDVVSKFNSSENGEKYERHCPEKGLDCLVPNPKGYKAHIPWPKSRDEVVLAATLLLAPHLEDVEIAWWRIN